MTFVLVAFGTKGRNPSHTMVLHLVAIFFTAALQDWASAASILSSDVVDEGVSCSLLLGDSDERGAKQQSLIVETLGQLCELSSDDGLCEFLKHLKVEKLTCLKDLTKELLQVKLALGKEVASLEEYKAAYEHLNSKGSLLHKASSKSGIGAAALQHAAEVHVHRMADQRAISELACLELPPALDLESAVSGWWCKQGGGVPVIGL